MNRKKLEKKIREKKKKQKKKKHTYTYLYAGESKLSYGQAAVASVRSGNSNSQPQLTRETSTAHAGKLPRGKHRRNVPVRTFGREESDMIRWIPCVVSTIGIALISPIIDLL